MSTTTKRWTLAALAAALISGPLGARAWARSGGAPAAAADPPRALLRIESRGGPGTLYVGQTVPVTIRAYFLDGTGVSLNGTPRLVSDALTLSGLTDKPAQTSAELRGYPYTVLTWTGTLTAARAGDARTDVELPVELSYREAVRAPAWSNAPGANDDDDSGDQGADDDPFASFFKNGPFANTPFAKDPFFSQMFRGGDPFAGMMRDLAGTIRQRAVTLHAPGRAVPVLELPSPQPAGFTGAVGSFDLDATLAGGPYHVGEPVTLQMTVKGQGSFARLSLGGLPSTPALTSYATAVSSAPGTDHEKAFTQTLVPRRAGPLAIPPVTLTYFDPRARRYVTRSTRPLRIDVQPAPAEEGLAAAPPAPSPAPGVPAVAGAPVAAPLPDVAHATLTPLIQSRRFQLALAVGIVAAAALAGLGRLRRTGALGRLRATRRLRHGIAAEQRALRDAARRGDAAALFAGGRRALQARLGAAWGVPPETIAAADVTRRLGTDGAAIREIFERADRHSYAGARPPGDDDLDPWPERISAELRALESRT